MSQLLTETYKRRHALLRELNEEASAYRALKEKTEAEVSKLDTIIKRTLMGLDTEKVALAETIIAVAPTVSNKSDYDSSEMRKVINSAIHDFLANDANELRRGYFGLKRYSHFGLQRSDHAYNMGPRHGNIVFSIGLNTEVLDKQFTPEEVEAVLYYLTHCHLVLSSKVEPSRAAIY